MMAAAAIVLWVTVDLGTRAYNFYQGVQTEEDARKQRVKQIVYETFRKDCLEVFHKPQPETGIAAASVNKLRDCISEKYLTDSEIQTLQKEYPYIF